MCVCVHVYMCVCVQDQYAVTHLYGEGDVSIHTEPTTFITTALVEAPTCHMQSEGRRKGGGGREGRREG